jgi:hypothetical protein
VEDAPESVVSMYVQVGDLLWFNDRIGDSAQWSRLVQSLMSSVPVE